MFAETQLHLSREKCGSQADVSDRMNDLMSAFYRLNGLEEFARVHEDAMAIDNNAFACVGSVGNTSRVEVTCKIG